LRERALPVIADSERTVRAIADLSEALAAPEGDFQSALANLERVTGAVAEGEGTVGRLVSDDRAARGLERAIDTLNANLDQLGDVVDNLERGSGDLREAAAGVRDPDDGLPAALRRANASLRALNDVLARANESMPALRQALDNTAGASESLPPLLVRTKSTLSELNAVLKQLRRSWLIGGDDGAGGQLRPISPVRGPRE
jgi:ABC-type transporter Mla subunit MlaD